MRVLAILISGLFLFSMGCAKQKPATEEQPPAAAESTPEATPGQAGMPAFDTPPEPVEQPAPVYPEAARAAGIVGRTFVTVTIDAAGMVTDAKVTESSGDATLDAAAVEAARKWTFKPAMSGGSPVASTVVLPVEFKLG